MTRRVDSADSIDNEEEPSYIDLGFLHSRRPRKTVVQSRAVTENETGSDIDALSFDEQDLSQIGTKGPLEAAA